MKSYESDYSEQLIGRWWLSIIVGLVALAAGFIVLINPVASYFTIAIWLGVAVLLSGIIGLVQCFSTTSGLVRNGWVILASIADIVIGILLLFNVLLTAAVLPTLFGIWLLYRGFIGIVQGMDLRSFHVPNAGWVVFFSVVMIVIAMAILLLPDSLGVGAIVLSVAIAFLLYGFSCIALGFRLYDVHRRARELE
ncbi:MAG: DUF308 domain-containing protein [Alistipes sp.]|nr:DUF308 domain-containing protein [Alistipes sp.]